MDGVRGLLLEAAEEDAARGAPSPSKLMPLPSAAFMVALVLTLLRRGMGAAERIPLSSALSAGGEEGIALTAAALLFAFMLLTRVMNSAPLAAKSLFTNV